MQYLGTRQFRWQRRPFRLALRSRGCCGRQLLKLAFHGGDIGSHTFFKQAGLLDGPMLGLDAEAPALVQRQFIGQLSILLWRQ